MKRRENDLWVCKTVTRLSTLAYPREESQGYESREVGQYWKPGKVEVKQAKDGRASQLLSKVEAAVVNRLLLFLS